MHGVPENTLLPLPAAEIQPPVHPLVSNSKQSEPHASVPDASPSDVHVAPPRSVPLHTSAPWIVPSPHDTQLPLPSHSSVVSHTVSCGRLLNPGTPLVHVPSAQSVFDGVLVSSSTWMMLPEPSHSFSWQSPGGLVASSACPPR